jgi:hypothetical protein
MSETVIKIENLSKHLFWDVDKSQLDFQVDKKIIIHRVLDYGLINDWNIIYKFYGIKQIGEIAKTIRDLDEKSMAFVSLLSKIPKEEFLCYTMSQSMLKHWIF